MNLRLYLFVSDIIEKNDGGRWVQDFLVLPQGIGSHSLVASDLVYLVLRSVCWWLNQWRLFLFCWSLMLLWMMGVGSDNLRSFWEIKCLQCYCKTLWMGIWNTKTVQQMNWGSVVVVSAGYQLQVTSSIAPCG